MSKRIQHSEQDKEDVLYKQRKNNSHHLLQGEEEGEKVQFNGGRRFELLGSWLVIILLRRNWTPPKVVQRRSDFIGHSPPDSGDKIIGR
jgi:hypothetical protein